jgi:hypothetical protein
MSIETPLAILLWLVVFLLSIPVCFGLMIFGVFIVVATLSVLFRK